MDGRRRGTEQGARVAARRWPHHIAGRDRRTSVPDVRIGDVDRERVVGRLCAAAGEGRLTLAEAADRQATAYGARFSRELAALLADLPVEEPDSTPPIERPDGDLLRDALRTILVINAIALGVGLSAIRGAAAVVALLSCITVMLVVVALEVIREGAPASREPAAGWRRTGP